MIESANQHPVHALLSHEGNVLYRIPPYQREYSWQKAQWEDLFEDLVESEGPHFLGTIITVNQTKDTLEGNILQVIDGQQRLTTLTLLLAAVFSTLKQNYADLDDDTRTDLTNLGRQLVRKVDRQLRVTPQRQNNNLADYKTVLEDAGLPIDGERTPWFPSRKIAKCYNYFRSAIENLANSENCTLPDAALRVHSAAMRSILVKIEVSSYADAFVLFESLNNRGMPLSPVDLIKNHLLAESEKKQLMDTELAFKRWNTILNNLGNSYAIQERFLRHYYNAFKSELPSVPNASVATKSNLIRIYETILGRDLLKVVTTLVDASAVYGRVNCVVEVDEPDFIDKAFQRLMRAQGAPSYVLLLWLISKKDELELTDTQIEKVINWLTSFFVRRNLTGFPQTYTLAKLFMDTIDSLAKAPKKDTLATISSRLDSASVTDDEFRARLLGRIYEENTEVARFILTTLAEDAMTKETTVDLWRQEKNHFVWTIEHILPQGENLPTDWRKMLGGDGVAAEVQEEHKHRLGNLTITAYNSNLGNKSFADKRDRKDSKGRNIGYRNGLSLNKELAESNSWSGPDIEARTTKLADQVLVRFPLASKAL